MSFEVWMMFSAAAFVNIISPGPAILLAISNGVSLGLRAVIVSALGNALGLLVLSSVSMFGLGLLLKTSAILFTCLKIIGAGYLIYLGIKKFNNNEAVFLDDANIDPSFKVGYFKKFREAFVVAVTNPKAILFFVAFFPLFLDMNSPALPQFIIMTFTFILISIMSLVTYGSIANSARHCFKNAKVVRIFNRVTGGIFIGFGFALLQVKS